MAHAYYLPLLLLSAVPAAAQAVAVELATTPPDTLRRPFRGTLPDSLAAVPTVGGMLRVQGQEQPARPFLTVQDQLRTVAGVQATPYDGSPGSGQVVRIRGAGTVYGSGQPLYVVDGLPALNDELTTDQFWGAISLPSPAASNSYSQGPTIAEQHAESGASPLQLLPPEAIASVEVLAGPAAVARYGPLGANGVVSIRTRPAASGLRPLRVRYAAYAGVQQVRQRYDLLKAGEFAAIANDSYRNQGGGAASMPYPDPPAGPGTDWQREAYHLAGLQQHQLSLEGRTPRTGYLLSADYRQQAGVLRGSDLSRYGLRLALDQRPADHLTLQASVAVSQTDQRLPYTLGAGGAVLAALLAPPTAAVRTTQGDYNGYETPTANLSNRFNNPLAISEYSYRQPRTRRLLAHLAADYQPAPGLTVQAALNLQRTQADVASYYAPPFALFRAPGSSEQYGSQAYRTTQLATRLAVHYERQLGMHHHLGAEVDYQFQQVNYRVSTEVTYNTYLQPGGPVAGSSFYSLSLELNRPAQLHRPWARLHYAFDSTLTVEAGLSYAHFRELERTEYYPHAQVSWRTRPLASVAGQALPLTLWLGAARTSLLGYGFGISGPAFLSTPFSGGFSPPDYRRQAPLRTGQLEAGLRLGPPAGRFIAQLVAYQRQSQRALLSSQRPFYSPNQGNSVITTFDEGTIRNQGLELTLAASWQARRWQGTTRLAASANRNRVQGDEYAVQNNAAFDNRPAAAFYGLRQDGLTANGALRYQDVTGDGLGNYLDQQYLGSGIPAYLASLSQQLRLGRLAVDAQFDGQFGYQVLNHQLVFLDVPTGYNNHAATVRDAWTPTNTATSVPAPGRDYPRPVDVSGNGSSRLLENGSHVRLSSLTVTYRWRQTATQDLSLWVGAQNLFVLTSYRGYDPNVSSGGSSGGLAGQDVGAVPVPRTWLLGVRASL